MSVATIREVRSTARPRHALATRPTSQKSRYNFPVTITDKFGRVRVVAGDTIQPKRGRKGRKRKAKQKQQQNIRVNVALHNAQAGDSDFDARIRKALGSIHAEQ